MILTAWFENLVRGWRSGSLSLNTLVHQAEDVTRELDGLPLAEELRHAVFDLEQQNALDYANGFGLPRSEESAVLATCERISTLFHQLDSSTNQVELWRRDLATLEEAVTDLSEAVNSMEQAGMLSPAAVEAFEELVCRCDDYPHDRVRESHLIDMVVSELTAR